jgi:hypothetical protein
MRLAGPVTRIGEMRKNIAFLSENLNGSGRRPRHKWKKNIIKEIECEGVNWIELAQDILAAVSCEPRVLYGESADRLSASLLLVFTKCSTWTSLA